MRYLVWNMTNYGAGYEVVGTYRSQKRAEKIRDALLAVQGDGDGWRYDAIESYDDTDDAKVINYFRRNPLKPRIEVSQHE